MTISGWKPTTSLIHPSIYYLQQRLDGELRELIRGCLYMNADDGYPKGRELLVNTVTLTWYQSWCTWKQSVNDQPWKQLFSLFLSKSLNAMSFLSHLSELNHPPGMLIVIQNLPNIFKISGGIRLAKHVDTQNPGVCWSWRDCLAQLASDTANDPVYGRDSGSLTDQTTIHNKARKRPNGPSPKSGSFAIWVKHCDKDSVHTCPLCKDRHNQDDCETFLSKSVDERRLYLQKRRLCFASKLHPNALHVNDVVWKSRSQLSSRSITQNTCKQSNDSTGFSSTSSMSHKNVNVRSHCCHISCNVVASRCHSGIACSWPGVVLPSHKLAIGLW